ncbi:aquaporin-like protein [Coniochaeta sp. 2T2.1]|nr:aquaporin-like protein [Coniochaeta sp. 2T2.1]
MVREEALSRPPNSGWRPDAVPETDERQPRRRRFSLHPDATEMEKGRKSLNNNGAFDGSFAGTVRQKTSVYLLPWYLRKQYFTEGWTDPAIFKAGLVELFATAFQFYLSGQFGISLMNFQISAALPAYVGIYTSLLLATSIYATAPASGGHLNPLITFASMICGLCPAPRAVVYMVAQVTGGALAGGMLRGSWGTERAVSHMGGGVFFDSTIITPGQVLVTEIVSCATVVFLAIGLGLDPRQQAVFGPQLGPLLVGIAVGLVTASTTGVAPGYTGASINPARAFGLAVARGSFEYQWIWWVGPLIGSIVVATMYNVAPPFHGKDEDEPKTEQNTR